ncbi:phospholipid/cholesterol/gamma-HCH transport system permease protein [Dyadobacter jejuensis]|uniref:Phospholipid/cholesterol/gamma-HCH transport system permease protein n=1 Tax=Dyadobacter jejuensis TaxID=1082580 RepID=A0A316BBE0_9BACT|nr:ABC transporter permease [Dyadobacter jejuensis]PWJ59867.1 phospholipid/cholesterol/gamma-HCH transport system permease protein [Dyadobacter jejuensis]
MSIIGKYFIFLGSLFSKGEKIAVYWRRFMEECVGLGVSSIFLVAIVSTFIGAVSCIQTAYNLVSPIIPVSTVALIVRDMEILELAPTITCIVLSGKVGSNIASELGTMRISEQIDALEVMGINSSSYLVLPKVLAAMFTFPMLVVMSAFLGILGGYLAGTMTGVITERDYMYGIRDSFVPYNIFFMLVKPFVFGFLISTISSFQGFYIQGGALEVGKASTQAVTNSCIAILIADFVLAQLLL